MALSGVESQFISFFTESAVYGTLDGPALQTLH
jgi:hypothetical protein